MIYLSFFIFSLNLNAQTSTPAVTTTAEQQLLLDNWKNAKCEPGEKQFDCQYSYSDAADKGCNPYKDKPEFRKIATLGGESFGSHRYCAQNPDDVAKWPLYSGITFVGISFYIVFNRRRKNKLK